MSEVPSNPGLGSLIRDFFAWFGDVAFLRRRLSGLQRQVSDSARFGASVVQIMMKVVADVALPDEQRKALVREFSDLNQKIISAALDREEAAGNPLDKSEIARLRSYSERVRAGQWFSPAEAADFSALAHRVDEDRRTAGEVDIGAIALAALAGFVLGMILKGGDE